MAQNHPILTPGILFISNLLAQARFKIKDISNDTYLKDHWLLRLLDRPNIYQTNLDFLEQMQFMKIAQGKVGIYVRRGIGAEPDSLFLLREDLIEYPEDFKYTLDFRGKAGVYGRQKIVYDKEGLNMLIRLDDILWLFDIPPISDKDNILLNHSRIGGLEQTLVNTQDSLVAKNIILKSNGKEMISAGSGDSFPFSKDEQEKAKNVWNSNYGLGAGRSRLYLTKSNAQWKSLHIALRDLGLDESVKTDCNIIYNALHIPPDVLSLDRKKTTYSNYRESLSAFIQNDIQSQLNDFIASMNILLDDPRLVVSGGYDHLQTMQFLKKREYEAKRTQADALLKLRLAGLPDQMALEMVGLPNTTKLLSLEELSSYRKGGDISDEREDANTESEENEQGEGNPEEQGQD